MDDSGTLRTLTSQLLVAQFKPIAASHSIPSDLPYNQIAGLASAS